MRNLPYVLSEQIEIDEKYVQKSHKGVSIPSAKPRKRGEAASKRGISNEKVCIITAVQRLGKAVANKSYVWTDGLQSYTKVLCEKKCTNKVLNTYSKYDAVNHLNNVNSFHSMIKEQYRFYRGVSSKYINRYNALFTLQKEYQGMDSQEFLLLIMKRLRGQVSYFFIRQIRKEDLFKFAIT